MKISLIIPIKNEAESIENLCLSINRQTCPPDETILVDGGSTDQTIEIVKEIVKHQPKFKLIQTPQASPGKGRNIGVENAAHEWIAFTDAGIKLETNWLERLVEAVKKNPDADMVYGNYAPVTDNFFEKCAVLTYVSAQPESGIREKFTASSMIKKTVWENVGGFLDLRAAEDLIFMEKADDLGSKTVYAPKAIVYWQLRPDIASTFSKFVLYSKYNVWAGRQWDWHYGILKQYLLVLLFAVLALVYSYWLIVPILLWLFARTAKRILRHRFEYGLIPLVNPLIFFSVTGLSLIIDLATFLGWGQAILQERSKVRIKSNAG